MSAPKVGDRVAITGVRHLAGHVGTVVEVPRYKIAFTTQWDVWVQIDSDDYPTPLGFYAHEVEPWNGPEADQ